MNKIKKRVVVGMSGGVDSSVAAWRLKQEGYDVIGLFMKNWDDTNPDEECPAEADFRDVRLVCSKLDIPYYSVNFTKEYESEVFANFLSEYKRGRTPNPDILCNRQIKFGHFLRHALKLEADYIATGHYARISLINDKYYLLKAKDQNKDQTYFLSAIKSETLPKVLFPLGGLHKTEIRQIAADLGLATAQKKDSTGICFIGPKNFRQFLSKYLPSQPGDIYSIDGELKGRHHGSIYYTLGQRQGLGIGGDKSSSNDPWFVVDKDIEKNRVIVAQGHDHEALKSQELIANNLNWLVDPPVKPISCMAKSRYRQPDQPVMITPNLEQNTLHVKFEKPQRAVTPGQNIVFYQDEICLGGGSIDVTL